MTGSHRFPPVPEPHVRDRFPVVPPIRGGTTWGTAPAPEAHRTGREPHRPRGESFQQAAVCRVTWSVIAAETADIAVWNQTFLTGF